MKRKIIFKNILLGFLSWLIPFVVSCLFYRPGGVLLISPELFKSLMIITGTISGCYLLFLFFRAIDADFIRNGIIVGFSWFAINILLDCIILLPMMKVGFNTYFIAIGLGYLAIPTISIAMGYLLNNRLSR